MLNDVNTRTVDGGAGRQDCEHAQWAVQSASCPGPVDSTTNPTWLQKTIKGSKMDQLRQGVNIMVGWTSSHICPVRSVLAYVAYRGFG